MDSYIDEAFDKQIGQCLLEYLRKDEFPAQLLQNPELCYLYFLTRLHDTTHGREVSGAEFMECWDAAADACRRRGGRFPSNWE